MTFLKQAEHLVRNQPPVGKKGVYDAGSFRSVRHGCSDANAYCRHCKWSTSECLDGKGVANRARYHAKTTLHTVDVYRENHTEFTSWKRKPV